MRFKVIGIGDYKGECIYDEVEDALFVDNRVVLDFKRPFKDYLRYTKFLINTYNERRWVSFQFLPQKEFLSRSFAIITAYNPKGVVLNEFDNFLRNSELESVLKTLGYEMFLSIGELFGYSEISFLVYDILRDDAISLADKFNQHSIFYNDTKSISIIEIESKNDILYFNYENLFKED